MAEPAIDVLSDGFQRVRGLVARVLDGLEGPAAELLTRAPAPGANTLAWLLWHLTRVQDDHIAPLAGREQAWTAQGWAGRFGLPLDDADYGFGHDADQVALVRAPADLLLGYHQAVAAQTLEHLAGLTAADLARVVDERWDPPVTQGVRLLSVLSDDLQHVGQAAYLRGLLASTGGAV